MTRLHSTSEQLIELGNRMSRIHAFIQLGDGPIAGMLTVMLVAYMRFQATADPPGRSVWDAENGLRAAVRGRRVFYMDMGQERLCATCATKRLSAPEAEDRPCVQRLASLNPEAVCHDCHQSISGRERIRRPTNDTAGT